MERKHYGAIDGLRTIACIGIVLNQMFGNGVLQYIVTVMLVLAATIVFSVVMKKFIQLSENKFSMLLTASARKG